MLTLGIETSCDETSAAVVSGRRLLSCAVSSSVRIHARYGGVVPEIATRKQVELINPVLRKALKESGKRLSDMDLISVTQGPGLVGALLVGISFAKALSLSLGVPIVGVNHIIAHLYANFLNAPYPRFPFIGLVVSGGHTSLIKMDSACDYSLLGQTQDDAVGEAFDKVSRVLGLGYPGGPAIQRAAMDADPKRMVRFPSPALSESSLDFSFSGIKTAVLYHVKKHGSLKRLKKSDIANISAGFEEAAAGAIAEKAVSACTKNNIRRLVVGGGVSANLRLRKKLKDASAARGIRLHIPPLGLCIDNGAMTAALGAALYKRGIVSRLDFRAYPNFCGETEGS